MAEEDRRIGRAEAEAMLRARIKNGTPEQRKLATQMLKELTSCFAAGTPLLVPGGSKNVEEFRPGDLILSRDENCPEGAVGAKVVEDVFVRTGRVLELRVGGRVIRTTPEHPFWVKGRGWIDAARLDVGDLLAPMHGDWLPVEGVNDTGDYATVYNLRVADYHTYFVGDTSWGFSVWAHNSNACMEILRDPVTKEYVLHTKTVGDTKGAPVLGKGGQRITGKTADEVRAAAKAEGFDPERISTLPDYLKDRFKTGKAFDKTEGPQYPYNQIEVEVTLTRGPQKGQTKKYVLDSYDPAAREIVSRKGGQLADIQTESAIRYMNELKQKYPAGARITDRQLNAAALRNKRLQGQLIIEVPVQDKPIPKAVLDAAKERGITIRDVTGKVYGRD